MKNDNSRKLLDELKFPDDLKKISDTDAEKLASEIREFLIKNVTKTGGHLASNLGIVELTIALDKVFDFPKDHLIFDVGHQSYVHKMFSGRMDMFSELRKPGGLSGFTKRSESEYDCFGAGHSSTSLSAALGFCEADRLRGSKAYTIAVIGDGAYTGGMIHEALNNCSANNRLVIILNENEMSISKNIGSFANYIAKIRSTNSYFRIKSKTVNIVKKIPLIGIKLFKAIRSVKQFFKNRMYNSNYFEDMGLYYLGPVDGNDYESTKNVLVEAKRSQKSVVVHIKTKKGKGYKAAEKYPDEFHGVKPAGEYRSDPELTFSKVFGFTAVEMAEKNDDICAVTAAMSSGTGLDAFSSRFPERFFDVGIAEEHALTFCAGLAADGMKPIFAVYSSFLQRGYDNIIHDIALQKLPVTICIDRAGLNSADGPTHHGIFDVSFLSSIPNIEIYTPATYYALKQAMDSAYHGGVPAAIRYPCGCQSESIAEEFPDSYTYEAVKTNFASDEKIDVVIITYGAVCHDVITASRKLLSIGINCGIILIQKLKPYNDTAKFIADALPSDFRKTVFVEEGVRNGGASMILKDRLIDIGAIDGAHILAIDDDFVYGDKGKTYKQSAGIDSASIFEYIKENLK